MSGDRETGSNLLLPEEGLRVRRACGFAGLLSLQAAVIEMGLKAGASI